MGPKNCHDARVSDEEVEKLSPEAKAEANIAPAPGLLQSEKEQTVEYITSDATHWKYRKTHATQHWIKVCFCLLFLTTTYC